MNKSSCLTVFLIFFILFVGGGASALATPNYEEGDTILPPDFEYGQGPVIAGDIYPPFGDLWGKKKVTAKETYSSGRTHSSFAPSPSAGFVGKHSIDLNVSNDSDPYVYATFDGVISHISRNHNSSVSDGDSSGQVLWLYDSNGKNQAIFAHIRIDRKVLANYDTGNKQITKGMVLGRIATKSNMKDYGLPFDMNGSHLHYQLWLKGNAQTSNQIEAWNY
ncbi:MAG: hypothetical protein UR93_C0035G0007 [Berkelbacteria bacterium GW2011_GWA2_35_9]|uniref:Peptidase M23 domain-containing protein n=1 Tax=Berkelbacteria bacterium GW2011_GWA2_35_9 TaxID=1618333 RepID=A0A0G0DG36_9BACT|nr:MAG: hypothetical protein UR93_C0035G0007 [Berkelbacteria bacterium GW2011_GWA2_35_9]